MRDISEIKTEMNEVGAAHKRARALGPNNLEACTMIFIRHCDLYSEFCETLGVPEHGLGTQLGECFSSLVDCLRR